VENGEDTSIDDEFITFFGIEANLYDRGMHPGTLDFLVICLLIMEI